MLPKFRVVPICPSTHKGKKDTGPNICNILFGCLFLLLFWSLVCFVASGFLTVCHLPIVNVCVNISLSSQFAVRPTKVRKVRKTLPLGLIYVIFCFVCLFLLLFWSLVCFVASDFLTTICHLAIVNVCVTIILSVGNTQISILLLCFLYLFVEFMISTNK